MTSLCSDGGGKRDRTADLLHAMQALSQLSYTPLAEQKRDFREQSALCKYPLSDYMRLFLEAACKPSQTSQARAFSRRLTTTSRPNSINTASIDGVCVVPATSRRTGIASSGIFSLCAPSVAFNAAEMLSLVHSALFSAVARSAIAARTASVTCC